MSEFKAELQQLMKNPDQLEINTLYRRVSRTALDQVRLLWNEPSQGKKACYFSAEFLIGRMVYNNLLNLGLLEDWNQFALENNLDPNRLEEVEDAALGNGGLGRLAACFLDSAATEGYCLNGYGIRYRYGLFKQYFSNGFQQETADEWLRFGDPWSTRRAEDKVLIQYGNQKVWAVPYDMPIIGYGAKTVNNLRLWQAEAVEPFDFGKFNHSQYQDAYSNQALAQTISSVLYPNDETQEGKELRLKQEYFFSSASLQSIVKEYKKTHGNDFSQFSSCYAIQLNDTHPIVSIPELLRILMEQESVEPTFAQKIVLETFGYTNHTIMAEAMEKWDVNLFSRVLPQVYPYVVILNGALTRHLEEKGLNRDDIANRFALISDNQVHMARIGIYATHSTNGVAEIHSNILKDDVLHNWYELYPERFNNKTNGITQRRWLALCNKEYAQFITERIGDGWITNLDEMKKLEQYADDPQSLLSFQEIKHQKKVQLADYVKLFEHSFQLNVGSIFDVQVKRLHEYKRQLLNAFSILDIYFGLKDGRIQNFYPTTYLFGGKAAPGYFRAKGIIKYINEISRLINNDPSTNQYLQVLMVQNYSVSYAEKLIPAADISEQISTAGTEASGTGNMKFMLNGAVTLGTYDGANVEIVRHAGEENNYIFGARVEDLKNVRDQYNPMHIYQNNDRIRRVLNTLTDGTFSDDGTGMFQDLFNSLVHGDGWNRADNYYLLLDFDSYVDAKLKANEDYQNRNAFTKKCILNSANSGFFSSDRTIRDYANDIWNISKG